jgi:hypothetical protein
MTKSSPTPNKKPVVPATRESIYLHVHSERAVTILPKKPHALPRGFAKSQALFAGPDPRVHVAPPQWFVTAAKKGKSAEEILQMLRRHVARGLSMCEARVVLNEIGRSEGSAAVLRRLFTQDEFTAAVKVKR